jgi:YggT family protein
VNPHAPLAPLFNSLSRPFLRPFQRLIPPIANVDLSPLVLLLVLQISLMLLAWLRVLLIPFIA